MFKKIIFLILIFMLMAGNVFATAQIGDILIYKGTEYEIASEPLESYFDKDHIRPEFEMMCTACWRGYVATWKIEDEYLYLVKIVKGTCDKDAPEIPISEIFPGQNAPVKAVWYSGSIRVPQGEVLEYVHMGYESIYEKEIFLSFDKGKLTREDIIDNADKVKEKQLN